MKPQTHTPVLIGIILVIISSITYCCTSSPVAILDVTPEYVHLGNEVELDEIDDITLVGFEIS